MVRLNCMHSPFPAFFMGSSLGIGIASNGVCSFSQETCMRSQWKGFCVWSDCPTMLVASFVTLTVCDDYATTAGSCWLPILSSIGHAPAHFQARHTRSPSHKRSTKWWTVRIGSKPARLSRVAQFSIVISIEHDVDQQTIHLLLTTDSAESAVLFPRPSPHWSFILANKKAT